MNLIFHFLVFVKFVKNFFFPILLYLNIFGYSPHLFFFILSFQCCAVNKNYRRLDSNHRSLLLKATTLPNCPHFGVPSFSSNVVVHLHNFSPPSCIHLQPFLQTFKFVLICNLFAQLFEPVNYLTIYHWYATAFFKKWAILSLFFVYFRLFKQTLQYM